MDRRDGNGTDRGLGFELDTEEMVRVAISSVESRTRGNRIRSVVRYLGIFAAAPVGMMLVSYASQSDTELAEELLSRGEDPAAFCAEKGGTLDEIKATGVTNDGVVFMHSADTPWDRYGQQEKFRFVVNDLGLAADGEVQVCEVGERGNGERQKLSIAPNQGDMVRLNAIVAGED